MNLLLAALFYYLSFFLGRSFVLITRLNKYEKVRNFKIFENNIATFYPILGMFFLGNFLFLANFFVSVTSNLVLAFLILGSTFNFLDKKLKKELVLSLKYLFVHLIISVSIYSANFQYDAGYYHLNYQNWIRAEKIVIGLSNIFSPLGLSSISDFLAAAFWLDNNFILLHLTSTIFISTLMIFLFSNLLNQDNSFLFSSSLFLIIFSFLDNFGANGGLNGFIQISGVVKPDQAFAVLFFFFCFLFLFTLKRNKINESEIFFLSVILFFSYQFRIISIYLAIPFICYIYLSKTKFSKFLKIRLSLLLILNIFWSIKWFLTTSCFIFPLEFTCFSTPWGSGQNALTLTGQTRSFNNSYVFGNNIYEWWISWLDFNNNQGTVINYFVSLLLIFIIKKILYKKIEDKKIFNFGINLFYTYVVFFYFLIWIFGSPNFRFLYGVIMFSVCVFNINIESYELRPLFQYKIFNQSLIMLFFVSALFIPRLGSYTSFTSSPFTFSKLKTVEIVYEIDDSGWNYPLEGDQCWINIECVPSKISINRKINSHGYLIFYRD